MQTSSTNVLSHESNWAILSMNEFKSILERDLILFEVVLLSDCTLEMLSLSIGKVIHLFNVLVNIVYQVSQVHLPISSYFSLYFV